MPDNSFLDFIRRAADELRKQDRAPESLDEWNQWREKLRRNLKAAWGGIDDPPVPLQPKILGESKFDGYRVERITFQTRPGVWMPANLYLPEKQGRLPAVLNVHGHWKGAKQDPHVQARCIGLAKLGFVSLAVDAFGAGERAIGTKLGEYHGEMTAGTLWPTGYPLSGLQVYENSRAVDYLQSRPEVDGEKIGITGASGGGNQTMYAGAWDERFKAVVPVCSVGNYRAYLGAACCMCEVVPGALTFTEEWAILAMVAPRALMVINATKDARQFSVEEAKKSLALASTVFELHRTPKNVRHTTFESPHDYSQAMREAMYGWMTLHLKGKGDGSPIAESKMETVDPEELRCFPGDSRPDDYATIPRFAAELARQQLEKKPTPDHLEFWESEAFSIREGLERVLGPEPEDTALELTVTENDDESRLLELNTEPGLRITALHLVGASKDWAILVDHAGMEAAAAGDHAKALRAAGWNVVCMDLRATGRATVAGDKVGRADDHNSAEWSLWIGRPLLGQWAWDVRRTLDAVLDSIDALPEQVIVVGTGTGGPVALIAAAQDDRFSRVGISSSIASFVTEAPYQGQRLGLLVPEILQRAGDIPHLIALIAPRPVLIAAPTDALAQPLPEKLRESHFGYPRTVYSIARGQEKFVVAGELTAEQFANKLREI